MVCTLHGCFCSCCVHNPLAQATTAHLETPTLQISLLARLVASAQPPLAAPMAWAPQLAPAIAPLGGTVAQLRQPTSLPASNACRATMEWAVRRQAHALDSARAASSVRLAPQV